MYYVRSIVMSQLWSSIHPLWTSSLKLFLGIAYLEKSADLSLISSFHLSHRREELRNSRKMLNPCCCISPRIGAFVFAVLDLIVAVPYAWATITAFVREKFYVEYLGDVFLCIFLTFLGLLLLFAAFQNSAEKVRLWLMLWLVFVILLLVFQVFNVSVGGAHQFGGGALAKSALGAVLIFAYEIWVVYAYLVELRSGPSALTYCPAQVV